MSIGGAWSKQVMGLPAEAARCVFEFAYHPAGYIHPERVHDLVPVVLQRTGVSSRDVSIGLLEMPGLSIWNGLDWSNVQHRLALLPLEGLNKLAWRLGLASVAPRLRRVIVGREWLALSEFLSADDWLWVDEWPRPMAAGARAGAASTVNRSAIAQPLNWLPVDALDALPLTDWPTHLQQWGWQVVDAACHAMPTDIGERLRLKLPLVTTQMPKPPHPTLALTALVAAYPSAVAQWNSAWDAMWLPETTTPQ